MYNNLNTLRNILLYYWLGYTKPKYNQREECQGKVKNSKEILENK